MRRGVLINIADPELEAQEVLASLFGFTPAESLIAASLAQGDKPATIAVALGIAQTTVAFHMRNIFQKRG